MEINTVTKKVITILGLTLGLALPLIQVEEQIQTRQAHEGRARREVAAGWGSDVSFTSPIVKSNDVTFYPTQADTEIKVESQEKQRGTFRVPVYSSTLRSRVSFSLPPLLPKNTHMVVATSSMATIQSFKVVDTSTGRELSAKLIEDGIRVEVDDTLSGKTIEILISARGTGPLTYNSSADQDRVTMTGNWTKPSFSDTYFPEKSKVSSKGFEASWTLRHLSRMIAGPRESKSVGLSHLWIGTDYAKINRAVKYGILFIALTFLLVFVVEFMSKARIHPLQYGLIGLSISVFYLLLLAISESVGFGAAYLISSLAVTSLIVFYAAGFVREKKFVGMVLVEQLVLSGFFYVLLSLEEQAFLVGSIGLFLALAAFMGVTRKFDWYSGTFQAQKRV